MAWVVPPSIANLVTAVHWQGRCGCITFRLPVAPGGGGASEGPAYDYIHAVGLHGAFGADLEDVMFDAAALWGMAPAGARRLIVGDWNADLLPTLAHDPWAGTPGRHAQHLMARALVDALADNLGAAILVPERCVGSPGGRHAYACLSAPVSRIPLGAAADTQRGALLDYAVARRGVIEESWLDWSLPLSDHAALVCALAAPGGRQRARPMRWYPVSHELVHAIARGLPAPASLLDFTATCLELQALARSGGGRRERKRMRPIWKVMWCAQQARRRQADADRGWWQRAGLHALAQLGGYGGAAELWAAATRGGVAWKGSALKSIFSVRTAVNTVTNGPGAAAAVKLVFGDKWMVSDPHRQECIDNWIAQRADCATQYTGADLTRELDAFKRPLKFDIHGVCVEAVRAMVTVRQEPMAQWLNHQITTGAVFEGPLRATWLGKGTHEPEPSEVRAIVPMPVMIGLVDALLAHTIHVFLDGIQLPDQVLVAGRKGVQLLDIVMSAQLVIEKGLDARSQGAVAQSDIKGYYDTLCPLRVAQWLTARGLPEAVALAFLRLHTLPACYGELCGVPVELAGRTRGMWTGSRTAVAAGRVPIIDLVLQRCGAWTTHGFGIEGPCLTFAAYVDNLVAYSWSAGGARAILNDAEAHLAVRWGLSIKPTSREFLQPRGADPAPADGWATGPTMLLLGCLLQSSGAVDQCVNRCLGKARGATFGTVRRRGFARLPQAIQWRLVRAAGGPRVLWAAARWPWSQATARLLDAAQRRMAVACTHARRGPREEPAAFVRRRAHEVSRLIGPNGRWSRMHGQRVLRWNSHLARAPNSGTWPALLLQWRGRAWLQARRVELGSLPSGGRTGTRVAPGGVATRWHDGVPNLVAAGIGAAVE